MVLCICSGLVVTRGYYVIEALFFSMLFCRSMFPFDGSLFVHLCKHCCGKPRLRNPKLSQDNNVYRLSYLVVTLFRFKRLQSPIQLHARPNNSIACIRRKMTSSLEYIKGTALEHQITPGEDTTKLDSSVKTLGRECNSFGLCISLSITTVAS